MEDDNIGGWVIGIAVIIGLFIVWFFITSSKVPAGYEAILVNSYGQQGVQDMPLVTGRVYFNPFTQDLITYPVFVQTKDYDEFTVNAKDWSVFKVDPTISYKIEAGATPAIYQKYRKEINQITDIVMFQMVKDSFRMVINQYTTDEIISKRWEIEAGIEKAIREAAIKDKITIERLTSGLKYPESIEASIASKNQAVQEAQKVENQLRVAEANAKIKQTNAEADAKAKITEAEANAKAIEIQSKAVQAQGWSDYIKLQWIKEVGSKWNGVLPTTTLSEGWTTLMQIPK